MTIKTVGIVGSGKLGTALGRLALAAGFETLVYSRPKPTLAMILETILPGSKLVSLEEIAERADVVILAVPHTVAASLPLDTMRGVIIDATNPWEATGTANGSTLSPAEAFPQLPIARSLNHISYEELVADAQPQLVGDGEGQTSAGDQTSAGPLRRAVAVSSNHEAAAETAAELVAAFGFDPVRIPTSAATLFNADGRLFGAWLSADDLRAQLAQ